MNSLLVYFLREIDYFVVLVPFQGKEISTLAVGMKTTSP